MYVIYIFILVTTTVGLVIGYSSDETQYILQEIRQMRQEHSNQIRTCEQKVDAILAENRKLLRRMAVLENDNKIMAKRLSALENPVNKIMNTAEGNFNVNVLKTSSLPLSISTTVQDTRAKANDNQLINDDFNDTSLKTTEGKHTVDAETRLCDKIMSKEKRVGPTENAVGFYAALAPDISLGDQQDLKFDHVYTNIGQGYEPRDGHFRAPVAGLYLLSATVLSAGTTPDDMLLEFVKNGVNVGQVYAARSLNEGSRIIVLSLAVGDMVWVRHMTGDPGTVANGSHYSSFSGVLISAFQTDSTSVH